MHAWYSEKASKLFGVVFYKKTDGSVVEATSVSPTINHVSGWSDETYIGEVTNFVGCNERMLAAINGIVNGIATRG